MSGIMKILEWFKSFQTIFEYSSGGTRRKCKLCGQRQEKWETNYIGGNAVNGYWWEDTGKIYNEDCKCHEEQTEGSRYDRIML